MKQRLILSLLSILALVYFALPRLPFHGGLTAHLFMCVWIGFCVIAFGGNLSGLLYGRRRSRQKHMAKKQRKTRERHYGRGTSI